jgi:hypothetical protein
LYIIFNAGVVYSLATSSNPSPIANLIILGLIILLAALSKNPFPTPPIPPLANSIPASTAPVPNPYVYACPKLAPSCKASCVPNPAAEAPNVPRETACAAFPVNPKTFGISIEGNN